MIPIDGLPRVVFVLGKGGVGRSTVATALATTLAKRRERVLVFEWALSEAIAPWFGLPALGIDPREVSPGVSAANFNLDDALRAFFVGHMRMGTFYRYVIHGRAVHRLVEAAPGIAEMMFLGHVCWLTTLAEKEMGLRFDRVIVDTPAAGHGASLLDLPATLAAMHASGLLGSEMARVDQMMRDPRWTGAVVVSLPEELAVEETLELVPRATKSLGRPMLAVLVNRSVSRLVKDEAKPAWLETLRDHAPPNVVAGLEGIHAELVGRLHFERQLRRELAGATQRGIFALDEQLALGIDGAPREIVAAMASSFDAAEAEVA
ncbi:MAG: ArsA family ATPase [Polyangiaceae bacterium]